MPMWSDRVAKLVGLLGWSTWLACAAPPKPPADPAASPPASTAIALGSDLVQPIEPDVPYDVDSEGRFPSPPVVPTKAAHGWRDTLGARDVESRAATRVPQATSTTVGGVVEGNRNEPGAAQEQPGFRVQIAACSTAETAHAMVRQVHENTPWRAYVEHEAPYYKVRVGDCPTRADCRALESRLRSDGWESAWIVRTGIVTP